MRRPLFPPRWRPHDRPTTPGVRSGELVFLSGQTGTDQERGELVGPSTYEQSLQALHNVREVLGEAGGSLADLVKVTVFLADMAEVPEMNRAYAELVPQPWPARSCVRAGLARPDLKVEIEAVARVGEGTTTVEQEEAR